MWGMYFFLKRFREFSQGRVPKQTCSQSAVRGMCLLMMRRRERSVHRMDISRAKQWQNDRDGG